MFMGSNATDGQLLSAACDTHLEFQIKWRAARAQMKWHRRIQSVVFGQGEADDVVLSLRKRYRDLLDERERGLRSKNWMIWKTNVVTADGKNSLPSSRWVNLTIRFLSGMEKATKEAGLEVEHEGEKVDELKKVGRGRCASMTHGKMPEEKIVQEVRTPENPVFAKKREKQVDHEQAERERAKMAALVRTYQLAGYITPKQKKLLSLYRHRVRKWLEEGRPADLARRNKGLGRKWKALRKSMIMKRQALRQAAIEAYPSFGPSDSRRLIRKHDLRGKEALDATESPPVRRRVTAFLRSCKTMSELRPTGSSKVVVLTRKKYSPREASGALTRHSGSGRGLLGAVVHRRQTNVGRRLLARVPPRIRVLQYRRREEAEAWDEGKRAWDELIGDDEGGESGRVDSTEELGVEDLEGEDDRAGEDEVAKRQREVVVKGASGLVNGEELVETQGGLVGEAKGGRKDQGLRLLERANRRLEDVK